MGSDFMRSPLVSWVKTVYGDGPDLDFKSLCSGDFLFKVWFQIDPNTEVSHNSPNNEDTVVRIKNLHILIRNINAFYQEVLGQLIMLPLPDIVKIGKNPDEESSMEEMNTLLLLMLGSAVQCEQKQAFIENIKTMDLHAQHTIVECIQKITDNPESVWSHDWGEVGQMTPEEQEHIFSVLNNNINSLVAQRDTLLQHLVSIALEQEMSLVRLDSEPCSPSLYGSSFSDKPHLAVEVADLKSRLRRMQHEVEEKSELLTELKEELDGANASLSRLKQENLDLVHDSRTAKAYRDEIDILQERVQKVDRLENEIQRYKDKMNELEFCRSRIEELREDNRILMETKSMLEEQLESYHNRTDHVVQLEADIIKVEVRIAELLKQESGKERLHQKLLEENGQLQVDKQALLEELAQARRDLAQIKNLPASEQSNLQEQLVTDAQTRILTLELENCRMKMLLQSPNKTPTTEEEKPLLESACEDENKCAISTGEAEKVSCLETTVQELKNELHSLEVKRDQLQKLVDQQGTVFKTIHSRCETLEQETSSLSSENHRLNRSLEGLQSKHRELQEDYQSLENENLKLNKTVDILKLSVRKLHDLEKENMNLEADNHKMEQERKFLQKDVKRLKNAIEVRDSTVEELSSRASSLERENKQLSKEVTNLGQASVRVWEQEKENKELSAQVSLAKRSLAALRQDLVTEKVRSQQLSAEIARISAQINTTSQEAPPTTERNVSDLEDTSCEVESESTKEEEEEERPDILEKSKQSIEEVIPEKSEQETNGGEDDSILLKTLVSELERKVFLSHEENENLRNQTSCLRDQNTRLSTEAEATQQRLVNEHRQNSELHSKLARLEVESSFLKSQNSSLTVQNTSHQNTIAQLEERVRSLLENVTELQEIQKSLLEDHETIQKLHNQLSVDYEGLAFNYNTLRTAHKKLKTDHKDIKEKLLATSLSQEEVTKLREALDDSPPSERRSVLATLQVQNNQLKELVKSMKESGEKTRTEFEALQITHKSLKTESNEMKLRQTRLQGEMTESRDNLASLGIELTRLKNYCETLKQTNNSLTEEHAVLLQHVTSLLSEYHTLVIRLVEAQNGHFQEENVLLGKVKDLTRQKNKLEEKIYEQAQQHLAILRQPEFLRNNSSCSSATRMRRTRSQPIQDPYQLEFLATNGSNPLSNLPDANQEEDKGALEDNEIPVRDPGPSVIEDSNANINPKITTNNSPSHQTTVENRTTVNFITQMHPERRSSPPPSTGRSQTETFLPRFQSFRVNSGRPRSTIFCGEGSSTPVFGSIMPRTRRNLNTPSTTANCTSSSESSPRKSVKGFTEMHKGGDASPNHQRDKKSSVWYEYGCV